MHSIKQKIILSVSSDLTTDQRVQKVAKSCYDNGFEVLLIGRKLRNSQPFLPPYTYKRFRLLFNRSFLFYAEYNIRLFFYLLFAKADILLSNDTDTLPANYCVSILKKKKLIFDAHELFPEVPELVHQKFVKKTWTKIEDAIFPKLKHSYTVCPSIAEYYNKKYGIDMQVIRNVPYRQPSKKVTYKREGKKIIYQGALNMGRGLEWIIRAMPYIDDAQLIIAGDGDIKDQLLSLTSSLQLDHKIQFIGKILPEKLKEYTLDADLGLCLLENKGLSYYYSLPNRIFDYLHAGIPVLATDFPEIRNIVETYKTGILVKNYDPQYLAQIINDILSAGFDTSRFPEIANQLCWENEEKTLMQIINEQ